MQDSTLVRVRTEQPVVGWTRAAIEEQDRPREADMELDDLYKQYHAPVFRYLCRMVDAAEAEDLTQETFVKVGKKLSGLRDPSRACAWIFKIALNTARDRLRQTSIAPPACDCAGSSPAEAAQDAAEQVADTRSRTPEEALLRREMIQCYLDFVSRLPRQYSEIYALHELEDLPDKAISDRLSLSLETVKIRLHRARTRLYEELRARCRWYYDSHGQPMGCLKEDQESETDQ